MNFKKIGLFFALKLLKALLLDKLTYAPLKAFVEPNYLRLEGIATLLTDKDPQDEAQLKQFWEEEQSGFITEGLETAKQIIRQKVKNTEVADLIVELLTSIQEEQGEEEG